MVVRIPIAVAYKLRKKIYIKEFTDLSYPDPLLSVRSTKLPPGAEILQIGVGSRFYQEFLKKFNQ